MLTAKLKAAKVSGAAALADAAIGSPADKSDLGAPPFLADEAPWPDPVEGAALLDELVATVSRYVVLPMSTRLVRSCCGSSSRTGTPS